MMQTIIEQEIASLQWANDKGIGSQYDRQIIALMVAFNEVNKNLETIAKALNKTGINVRVAK